MAGAFTAHRDHPPEADDAVADDQIAREEPVERQLREHRIPARRALPTDLLGRRGPQRILAFVAAHPLQLAGPRVDGRQATGVAGDERRRSVDDDPHARRLVEATATGVQRRRPQRSAGGRVDAIERVDVQAQGRHQQPIAERGRRRQQRRLAQTRRLVVPLGAAPQPCQSFAVVGDQLGFTEHLQARHRLAREPQHREQPPVVFDDLLQREVAGGDPRARLPVARRWRELGAVAFVQLQPGQRIGDPQPEVLEERQARRPVAGLQEGHGTARVVAARVGHRVGALQVVAARDRHPRRAVRRLAIRIGIGETELPQRHQRFGRQAQDWRLGNRRRRHRCGGEQWQPGEFAHGVQVAAEPQRGVTGRIRQFGEGGARPVAIAGQRQPQRDLELQPGVRHTELTAVFGGILVEQFAKALHGGAVAPFVQEAIAEQGQRPTGGERRVVAFGDGLQLAQVAAGGSRRERAFRVAVVQRAVQRQSGRRHAGEQLLTEAAQRAEQAPIGGVDRVAIVLGERQVGRRRRGRRRYRRKPLVVGRSRFRLAADLDLGTALRNGLQKVDSASEVAALQELLGSPQVPVEIGVLEHLDRRAAVAFGQSRAPQERLHRRLDPDLHLRRSRRSGRTPDCPDRGQDRTAQQVSSGAVDGVRQGHRDRNRTSLTRRRRGGVDRQRRSATQSRHRGSAHNVRVPAGASEPPPRSKRSGGRLFDPPRPRFFPGDAAAHRAGAPNLLHCGANPAC